jgi:hypothetical protein
LPPRRPTATQPYHLANPRCHGVKEASDLITDSRGPDVRERRFGVAPAGDSRTPDGADMCA